VAKSSQYPSKIERLHYFYLPLFPGRADRGDLLHSGEFFHIYTGAFQNRFFFEVVQRENYDLFGAANTPVRLAAQARAADDETALRIDLDTAP
jgi:hypothetical protein